jgi:hypothetical protein
MDFLEYKGYRGSVEYSKADNCLCGEFKYRPQTVIWG